MEFESNNNLFDIVVDDNIPLWQLARYDIYNKIVGKDHINLHYSFFKKTFLFIHILLHQIKIIFSKFDILYIGSSRKVNKKNVDRNYELLMNALDISSKCMYFETNYKSLKLSYKNIRSFVPILKLVTKIIATSPSPFIKDVNMGIINEMAKRVKCTYNIEDIENIFINDYLQFKLEYLYFKFILNYKKVKKVFFTKDGMQYALIYACREQKIPIAEFQHGDIVNTDVSISFENTPKKNLLIPDFHLVYSDYWIKNIETYSRCIEVGKYSIPMILSMSIDTSFILLITDLFNMDFYCHLAKELADSYSNYKIIFKLHPRMASSKRKYNKEFFTDKRIIVISTEYTVEDLCQNIINVVGSYSTAMYEAYDEGCNLFIYRTKNDRQYTFLENENIEYFEKSSDLINQLQKASLSKANRIKVYFKDPNINNLKKVLTMMNDMTIMSPDIRTEKERK